MRRSRIAGVRRAFLDASMERSKVAESRVDQARRAAIAAVTLGAAGVLCAWPVFRAADNAAWQLMIPLSGLAAFIVGGLSSFTLHDERSRHPRLRGVLAGVLTGILSHPLAWYLGILFNFFRGATRIAWRRTVGSGRWLARSVGAFRVELAAGGLAHRLSGRTRGNYSLAPNGEVRSGSQGGNPGIVQTKYRRGRLTSVCRRRQPDGSCGRRV